MTTKKPVQKATYTPRVINEIVINKKPSTIDIQVKNSGAARLYALLTGKSI